MPINKDREASKEQYRSSLEALRDAEGALRMSNAKYTNYLQRLVDAPSPGRKKSFFLKRVVENVRSMFVGIRRLFRSLFR